MDQKAIDVRALAAKFLNFIHQNWIIIALNIAAAIICVLSIRYGLSRPFNLPFFSFLLGIGIFGIVVVIKDIHRSVNTGDTPILADVLAKYQFLIIVFFATVLILFVSSFQNVDARSWKFDRGTGELVERVVFIWPGSTLEREYFVVERKPLKEVSVWILVPAIVDAGWSGDRKQNSLRKEVVLTLSFKNYKSYETIHYEKIPELRVNTAPSRAQAPEAVRKAFLWQVGLTDKDIEIIKIDGLE